MKKSNGKYTVAHLVSEYLITNHSYIYDHLLEDKHFRKVVIARGLFPGKENFPFSPLHGFFPWFRLYPYINKYIPTVFDYAADNYFKNWIRKENADLLHAHFGSFGAKLVDLKKDVGLPMVVSFYGDDASSYPARPEWASLYQLMFKYVEGFIAICDDMKQKLVSFGCSEEKIHIAHVATDLEKYSYKKRETEKKGTEEKPVEYLMVATFTEKKGHRILIPAFANLLKQRQHAKLTVIGFGPLKESIKQIVTDYGLDEKVTIIDTANHPDFFSLFVENLHSKDIFVHPSLTTEDGDAEGTPTVIMAASAAGMPVISTWHAGIPEVVEDKVTGYLVAEKDVSALTKRMVMLYDQPGLWNNMGSAGRKKMEEEFSRKALNNSLQNIYTSVLQKKEGSNG